MASAITFYRGQIGGPSVIDYSYTDSPAKLFLKDLRSLLVYSWAIPRVLSPLWPCASGDLGEMYPSFKNVFCLVVHGVLIVLQLMFLVGLPLTMFFPLWMGATGVAGFLALNWALCRLLNTGERICTSDDKFAPRRAEHEHEAWVYLNGVAIGDHWLKNNLNRLALTFGRPVLGIHNKTSGVLFDLIECLIQRNFTYATKDVRICYKIIRDLLYKPDKSKIIFILHSQGGIEGGLVLDWLLQELPQDLLSKLEVYTFGNAANHFNNPHRRIASQVLTRFDPLAAIKSFYAKPNLSAPLASRVEAKKGYDVTQLSLQASDKDALASHSSSRTSVAANDRAISYIEHYAHGNDFVALWGVLHFARSKLASAQIPRFMGRIFSRAAGRGHLLNQHYLDAMFPLKRDPETGQLTGADEDNAFMEETVEIDDEVDDVVNGKAQTRESFDITYLSTELLDSGDAATFPPKDALAKKRSKGAVKVKELSRLWSYRNGQSPG
ncbi:hypothetical protein E4U53_003643 [Claviceps sorghi]|nr:hypothetical protein E4U53_003643 [Claviceps sorghi]